MVATANKSIAPGISLREACELVAELMLLKSAWHAVPWLHLWLRQGLIRWTYMFVGGIPRQKHTLAEEANCVWGASPFHLVVSLNASQVSAPTWVTAKDRKVVCEVTVYGIRVMPEDIVVIAKTMVTVPPSSPRGADLAGIEEPDIISVTGEIIAASASAAITAEPPYSPVEADAAAGRDSAPSPRQERMFAIFDREIRDAGRRLPQRRAEWVALVAGDEPGERSKRWKAECRRWPGQQPYDMPDPKTVATAAEIWSRRFLLEL